AWRMPLLGAVILFGGIAAGAGYLIHRSGAERDRAVAVAPTVVEPGRGSETVALGSAGSAEVPPPVGSNAIGSNAEVDAGSEAVAPDAALAMGSDGSAGSAGSADVGSAGSGSDAVVAVVADGSGAGSNGSGSDDIEMDPTKADDPNPSPEGLNAVDEASDAPAGVADIEKRPPVHAQPVLAKSIREAVQQIKAGQRELALSSLRSLWKTNPKSAYIPFLLGNLYFDKLWWAVAMDHYKAAIQVNAAYKRNAILNQNIIRTLASTKTRRRAQSFLRFTIGPAAGPFVKYAAVNAKNPVVRKQAAQLAKAFR
ncbi:MAG: hypothetical protein H0T79_02110, partial [Deltaproteobacteria bacterium]|nr:hypothetical protein [Deltaproteobacteria bacterium]